MCGPPGGLQSIHPGARRQYPTKVLTKTWAVPAPDLDARRPQPQGKAVSRPDGRSGKCRKAAGEESPGSTDERCRITSGGGNPRESATEKETAGLRPARVKRCGKSAPRGRQRQRQGKPHREQNRIGAARGFPRKRNIPDLSGPAARVGCLTRRATGVAEEWPSRTGRPVPYRTRLTGRLMCRGASGGAPAGRPTIFVSWAQRCRVG